LAIENQKKPDDNFKLSSATTVNNTPKEKPKKQKSQNQKEKRAQKLLAREQEALKEKLEKLISEATQLDGRIDPEPIWEELKEARRKNLPTEQLELIEDTFHEIEMANYKRYEDEWFYNHKRLYPDHPLHKVEMTK
jgi:hypothetical protein